MPPARVDNKQFSELTGRDPEWFVARTGIQSRSRANDTETTTSMGIDAVRNLLDKRSDALDGVDLIIGASYTPEDTLSTLPFRVQRQFGINEAKVYFLSTACSSFISALELSRVMLLAGEATKALIVVSEHNSFYSDDADQFSGHLWGDGAAAVLVTQDEANAMFSVQYVSSRGVACEGKGPDAISLRPSMGALGLQMTQGRDVFAQACEHLVAEVRNAVSRLKLHVSNIDWLVPHQANLRILSNVAKTLNLAMERCVVTVDKIGNTGCASIPISIAHALPNMRANDLIAAAAFGGGYSCGAAILQKT
ncbi:MAG: ketoacyl-ACP synthase III [Gammaproteobacteria bacterium]|nr:ketoacyl-ACP synthase III [Gammaproteobacteria bacterium]